MILNASAARSKVSKLIMEEIFHAKFVPTFFFSRAKTSAHLKENYITLFFSIFFQFAPMDCMHVLHEKSPSTELPKERTPGSKKEEEGNAA